MKCMNCGAEIPEDQLICPGCGQEIQIVPDYTPLEDVLAAEVKGAVYETMTFGARGRQEERYRTDRNVSGRSQTGRYQTGRNGTGRVGQATGRTGRTGHNGYMTPNEKEGRRRQAERKKMLARKKKKRKMTILGILAGMLAVFALIGVLCYQNSYTGLVKRGTRQLTAGEYEASATSFRKAIAKNKKRSEAYSGLAKVYTQQDDLDAAEQVFLDAIDEQDANVDFYRAVIEFYLDTEQESKVSPLFDECSSDKVLEALKEYVSEVPKFSLDGNEEYDDVQALELTGTGEAIYYTVDGTDPTAASTKYKEPIRLDEGETEVRAISVNKKGIPSLVVKKTYTVEFPIADAPSVTPSTGQYESAQTIEVVVPDNYTAYYTTDGSDPDPQNTETTRKYTGPFDMPEGNTIFSVVLADQKGRLSNITKRNYELILSE